MLTDKELMMVKDMDIRTARVLKLFITFQQPEKEQRLPTFKNIMKYGKQELSTRLDIPFYTRSGYQPFAQLSSGSVGAGVGSVSGAGEAVG